MVEKTLGYVELEWTCPNCQSRNPGATRTCQNCGAQQSAKIEFEQAAQETVITDKEQIAQAEAAPDIHCAYCGTRNPASAKVCKQCGGQLAEGEARGAGKVLGAHREEPAPPLICPACGASNPATARKCSQCGDSLAKLPSTPTPAASQAPSCSGKAILFLLLGLAAVGVIYLLMSARTSDLVGVVQSAEWKRTITIDALVPVTRETWRDQLPSTASLGQCTRRVHHTQDQPAAGAREVCGTPYTVDQGTGYGKVVQKCRYEVYADWCQYQTTEWQRASVAVAEGADLNPHWPSLNLDKNERIGAREEQYAVIFTANDRTYRYSVGDLAQFAQYAPGSRWRLEVNSFGAITGLAPE